VSFAGKTLPEALHGLGAFIESSVLVH